MATQQEIKDLEEKILKNSSEPEFLGDLFSWAREKYSRQNYGNPILNKVHSRNLYMKFLQYVHYSGLHQAHNGRYEIIKYLSHGEQAPMPVHIRLLLDGDEKATKNYIKKIKFTSE